MCYTHSTLLKPLCLETGLEYTHERVSPSWAIWSNGTSLLSNLKENQAVDFG